MGELIDINEILAVSREIAQYDREDRERFLAAFERIRPILRDLKTVMDYVGYPSD
jgi:hypothetical protein